VIQIDHVLIVCVVLCKVKAIIWKFSKFMTEKSMFQSRFFFLYSILKIQDLHTPIYYHVDKAYYWTLLWASWIQILSSQAIYWSFLLFSFHLHPGLPCGLFWHFLPKIQYNFLIFSLHTTYLTHLFHDLTVAIQASYLWNAFESGQSNPQANIMFFRFIATHLLGVQWKPPGTPGDPCHWKY
jgi:hypothetical protein